MYRHIIDRSNLDEVVAYNPKTKHSITRREDLESDLLPRSDIVLFNGTRSGKEYVLHVAEDGYSGDIFLLDFLTDEELKRVHHIATLMRYNAEVFPPARKLIAGMWKS